MRAPIGVPLAPSPRIARLGAVVGSGLVVLLAVAGIFAPAVVLHGWLIAFASLAGTAIGCVVWLSIHRLTGGRWGEAGRPALVAGSTALPATVLLVLPLILASRWFYPWAADPATAGPGVARFYLNAPALTLRSLILLGGLSLAAWSARAGELGRLTAAMTLLLYGVLMNLSAFDWLLSLDPRYVSSAFGMQIIVAQLLSALCFVVLATEAPESDGVWDDFGGLMLACLLGEAYLLLMTFVVHWYGNLPVQAAWYLARSHGLWRWLEIGGTLIGAVGPGVALLFGGVRRSPSRLRTVAAATLCGLLLQYIWLVAPHLGSNDGGWAMVAAVAALGGCGGLMAAVMFRASPLPTKRITDGV